MSAPAGRPLPPHAPPGGPLGVLQVPRRPAGARHHQLFAAPGPQVPVPVGVTDFVAHETVPRELHHRLGGELQTLRLDGGVRGVMTAYPHDSRQVADMLKRAMKGAQPRIVNLMNPGDGGIDQSYIDKMPEGRTCRIGPLRVRKTTIGQEDIGSNGHGGRIQHVRTRLMVRDEKSPNREWRAVDHHAFNGWIDTTELPPETFGRMWRSLYEPGRTDQGVMHCAGGVGRTPTLLWRLIFQQHLDSARRRNVHLSPAHRATFLHDLTAEARMMRGPQVLPDEGQLRMLYASCLRAVPYRQA